MKNQPVFSQSEGLCQSHWFWSLKTDLRSELRVSEELVPMWTWAHPNANTERLVILDSGQNSNNVPATYIRGDLGLLVLVQMFLSESLVICWFFVLLLASSSSPPYFLLSELPLTAGALLPGLLVQPDSSSAIGPSGDSVEVMGRVHGLGPPPHQEQHLLGKRSPGFKREEEMNGDRSEARYTD
ncbi:hypothetical protein FQA47_017190 [Oryzias melastigma]|uniref:Uncharacterized protein n=1 Tax=Oryzias melastigma TaxID=30732 RepID=A0A834F0Q2_ORYME|nr:hypothetical protein FQA47_017190 [Oryzias melastigma]